MLLCTNRIFVQRHLTTQPLYLLTRAKSRLAAIKNAPQNTLPDGVVIHVSESLSDRRSVFVGRACRVTDPSAVSSIISYLMTDKRIAKASHPTIYAWRCIVDEKIKQGNDDCGEASAGGKLSDLLELLNVNDILVVVTRNLGGSQIGPDRFRHISQVAKEALEKGGFLEKQTAEKSTKSSRK